MTMKKAFSLLLSCTLLLGVLAGCSPGTDAPGTTPNTSAQTSSGDTGDGREMKGNLYKSGLPIVKEQETFKLLVTADSDPSQMTLFQNIEKETNVKVEWLAYPYDIAVEKKNLMYTSGDYPDAVGGWLLENSDIITYGPQGIYIPVEDLIREYAPNVQNAIDNFPDAKSTLTAPDGHIYTFALMGPQDKSSWIMHINKKWLDKLNLAVPTTTEQLTAVLEAFKTQDPNGNNKADEIPMSFRKDIYGGFFGAFGRVDPTKHLVVENDKVVFTPMQEEYKTAIQYLNGLYTAGLIDQEAFTHDSTQYQAKGKEADALYGVYFDFQGVNVVGTERYNEEYIPLAPVTGPDGTTSWIEADKWVFRNQFAITSKAKNPETIVRWLDHLYEPDMSYQVFAGPLGTVTEKTSEGKLRFLPFPEGKTESAVRNENTISGLPYCIMPDYYENIEKNQGQLLKAEMDAIYEPYIIKEKYPQVWMTPEESSEISVISADILKYVNDMQTQWIAGLRDINADWDGYLKDLEKMNVKKFIEVHQSTVDRALSVN